MSEHKAPPFYITKTLMGYGDGEDLNRITLHGPGGYEKVLFKMGEPRTPDDIRKWAEIVNHINLMHPMEPKGDPEK